MSLGQKVVASRRRVLKDAVWLAKSGRQQQEETEKHRVGNRPRTCRSSQNNTPQALIPLLRRFDREIWWGEYIVVVAEKM
jgi:hypothetical protein